MSATDTTNDVPPDEKAQRRSRPLRSLLGAFWRSRERGLATRMPRRRVSALAGQIILLNLIAFFALSAGVWWVQSARDSLVSERISSLMAQAQIISAALARYAPKGEGEAEDAATDVDAQKAAELLNLLVGPTGMRARIFGRDGATVQDTRFILTRNQVQSRALPPPGQPDVVGEAERWFNRQVYSIMPGDEPPPFVDDEPRPNGKVFEEVKGVLDTGEPGSGRRINAEGNLIVSVAAPIKRLQFVMGVLMLSTEAGDIDDALRQEWTQLLLGGVVAMVVLALASWFILTRITEPLRRLAQGADAVRRGGRRIDAIPNLSRRLDEIGDLSVSLRSMTSALYARMDAIEQFAADVAHEIKNPLTSVGSAVETLRRTTDEDKRARLMTVIYDDVRRLDRLITDISDASRLDAELSRERTRDVNLTELVGAIAQMFDDPDAKNSRRVVLDLADGLVVRGLDGPLAQVFRNIIENAVSFSPKEGEIRVAAYARDGRAVVTVEDQGPGIPEDNLEVIFRRFYTERPTSHGFGKNSGLGLSITRQIVEVHNGRITASNVRDADGAIKGARFTVELPLSRG
ncbi:MAG: stimulus-sensing domain-containing protein [Alphaproteobacteria bacterium]|nr:stimulus-sensing domain-containing protein [Alphaproteobacteria bacterium]